MKTAIEVQTTLERHVSTVSPGQSFSLNSAHQIGDGVWQGDLGIEIVNEMPDGYELVKNPKDADRQLAIEAGAGSHHRLRSLDGVKIYRPRNWGQDEADLRGPVVVFSKPNAIVHEPGHDNPHGTVVIDCPMTVQCRYQQNLDTITKQARRAAD